MPDVDADRCCGDMGGEMEGEVCKEEGCDAVDVLAGVCVSTVRVNLMKSAMGALRPSLHTSLHTSSVSSPGKWEVLKTSRSISWLSPSTEFLKRGSIDRPD